MKILFVTDLCPIKEDEKGLPLTLLDFILDFKKLGHEVILFRPNIILNVLLRRRKILPEGEYEYKGIKCINKNYFSPYFHKNQFLFLKNQNFDVILSHMPSGILAANKISKVLNIPYFASVHSSDIQVLESFKYILLRNQMKKGYEESKKILPRSYWLKEKIQKHFPNKEAAVIPSGIDNEIIKDENKLNHYAKPYKLLSAGSLIKRKNFENLIKACAECGVKLDIAGCGRGSSKLEKLINRLKAKEDISLLGQKQKPEIYDLMRNTPIFILTSLRETFGMVYLEAMASGCVVICSENSGISGIIKDGLNGFLTKTDTNSIIKTIKRIQDIENIDEIRQNAIKTARKFEKLSMAKNYLKNILV